MSYLKQFKDRVTKNNIAVSAGGVPPLIPVKTDEKIEREGGFDSHHIRSRGGFKTEFPRMRGGVYPAKTAKPCPRVKREFLPFLPALDGNRGQKSWLTGQTSGANDGDVSPMLLRKTELHSLTLRPKHSLQSRKR
jgi:hypothetical protein